MPVYTCEAPPITRRKPGAKPSFLRWSASLNEITGAEKVSGRIAGPGLEHIPAKAVPMLRQAGASEELIHMLVSENPTNFYGV